MTSKADYIYKFDGDFLIIKDLNLGGMSVTNSIEDVVKNICDINNRNPNTLHIIYRDMDGIWDGWNNKTKSFILIQSTNVDDAINYFK